MSKPIKITPEYREQALREFAEALLRMKMSDGKISYTRPLEDSSRRATVVFTPQAWMKMYMLIMRFNMEVAWHGVAARSEDPDKDEYIISDILVYPQKVSAATVETDQEEYESWLYSQPDEVFNNLRMQGHSHVNMSTSPSGVDTTHQGKIMSQLEDDMFYIFMIWNKSMDKWIKVYDFAKNTMFETKDVDVRIDGEGWDLAGFITDAKDLVKSSAPTSCTGSGSYGSGYYGGGYGGGYYNGGYSHYTPPAKTAEQPKTEPPKAAEAQQPASKPVQQLPAKSEAEDEKKTNAARESGWESTRSSERYDDYGYEDDDDDDGYGGFGYFNASRYASDPFYARGY